MRFSKERIPKYLIIKIITFSVVISTLAWVTLHYGYYKEDCGQSIECFDEAFNNCKPAQTIALVDNNYYSYVIGGERGDNCKIEITLEKMAVGASYDLVNSFEGKSMACMVPLDRTKEVSFDTMPDILTYCTGPLKEVIYEQIIANMYTLIVRNMGPIVNETSEFYKINSKDI